MHQRGDYRQYGIPVREWALSASSIGGMSMNKIALRISVGVDDCPAERAIITGMDTNDTVDPFISEITSQYFLEIRGLLRIS